MSRIGGKRIHSGVNVWRVTVVCFLSSVVEGLKPFQPYRLSCCRRISSSSTSRKCFCYSLLKRLMRGKQMQLPVALTPVRTRRSPLTQRGDLKWFPADASQCEHLRCSADPHHEWIQILMNRFRGDSKPIRTKFNQQGNVVHHLFGFVSLITSKLFLVNKSFLIFVCCSGITAMPFHFLQVWISFALIAGNGLLCTEMHYLDNASDHRLWLWQLALISLYILQILLKL